MTLSKSAKTLLGICYKQYKEDLSRGSSDFDARMFMGVAAIKADLLPDWSEARINDACNELCRAELMSCQHGDNMVTFCALTDAGIAACRDKSMNGFLGVLSAIERILGILRP